MNQKEEYIELDLKALLFYVLRQWKPIVIFAVVIALLLGCFMAVSEYQTSLEVDEENKYWIEYMEYEEQVALYEDQIDATQTKIENLQNYIDNSLLMKADHRNVYIAKATFYVDTDYKILPENTYQTPNKTSTLTWYYHNFLQDYGVYEEIAQELGMEAKYLMELISVGTSNGETINLSVTHPYERSARSIMDILQTKLQDVHDHLNKTVEKHSLTPMMNTCGVYVSDAIKNIQQANNDELIAHQDNLLSYKKALHDLKEEGGPGELSVPFAFVKGVIIGGVIGGVLAVVYYAAMVILKNRVHAPEQLVSMYYLPVFGEMLKNNTNPNPITKLLNKLEGRLTENSEENLHFIAENIKNHCNGISSILICNDTNEQDSIDLANTLKSYIPDIQFVPAGNLLKDASALHQLAQCDAVLRLVSRDHSAVKAIRKESVMLRECKKTAVGFIFVD